MAKALRMGLYLWPTAQHDGGLQRAIWAEAQGYDDIWLPDGGGMQDALTLAAAVAARTSRARICTGVVPVYTRPPAVLATSALAISRLAPGRFVLGLGSSTEAMVARWYGREFVKPLTAVKETVILLRSILAGEKTDFSGEVFSSKGFRLAEPVEGGIPILLAAMGPKMLEMAGQFADGVVLNNFTPVERVPQALEHLDTGAKRAGKRVEDLEVSARVSLTVTDDNESALETFRREIYGYGSTEIYRAVLQRMGYGRVAEEMEAGFKARDRARVLAAIPDELVAKVFAWGDEETCHARIRAYYKAGVGTVAIGPISTDPQDFQRTCEAFAPSRFSLPA